MHIDAESGMNACMQFGGCSWQVEGMPSCTVRCSHELLMVLCAGSLHVQGEARSGEGASGKGRMRIMNDDMKL